MELQPCSAPPNALLLIPVGARMGHPCTALLLHLTRAAPLQEQPLQCFKAVWCVAAVNGEEMTWVAPGPCPCGRACAMLQAGPAWSWLWIVQEESHRLALLSPPCQISPLPRKAQGQGSAGSGADPAPTAEHPLGHLKAASGSSGALAGVLGL